MPHLPTRRTARAVAVLILSAATALSCGRTPAPTSHPPGGFPEQSPTQDTFDRRSPGAAQPATGGAQPATGAAQPATAAIPAPATELPAPTPPPSTAPGLRTLFPHVRADLAARTVEFDGTVPIDCHNPKTPNVYLEVVACIPDTKEHETLVVTPARPSHIHAALLAAGFQPGAPATWSWDEKKLISTPPTGDSVEVSIAYRDKDGREIESPATDWIVSADSGAPFAPAPASAAAPRWVFAGSVLTPRQGQHVYEADGSGVLIGLTTFGSETIAWHRVISPDAEITEPEWIADARKVPPVNTAVVVRIRPALKHP